MDFFYSISYVLGLAIGIAVLALLVAVIVLIVRKIKKSKRSSQSNMYNFGTVQDYQSESICSTKSIDSEAEEQRWIQREQQKIEAVKTKTARLARKKAEKEAARLEKQRKRHEEQILIDRISELDIQYPLIQDFHSLEFTHSCKSRREYESLDPDIAAMEYIRSHPEEMEFYNNVVLPNAKNQVKYERAFEEQIEPYTSRVSILKKKKRKGQISTFGSVIISYAYTDKATRKRKEDRRVEIFKSLDKVYQDVKKGIVRQSEKQRFAKGQRAAMTSSLRYDILQRDGFRCQLCGATQVDGVKLHVDHIIPVSKGGETVPENLRTLCDRCNLGKGAKVEAAHDNRVAGATASAIHHNLF